MVQTRQTNGVKYVKADELHENILTLDTHLDTPLHLMRSGFDFGIRHDPHQSGCKCDLPRMLEGGLDAAFFALFIGQGPRSPESNEKARKRALKIYEAVREMSEANSEQVEPAFSPEDAFRIKESGKRAIYLGLENGYAIGNDLSLIQTYHDLGVRYVTLCHNRHNDICDSSTDPKGPEHDGLSDYGRKVVQEMNRLGMIIDVSHISNKSFYDVIEVSETPVAATHSCARALCDHPRNLDDKMLEKLAENGGVIQICVLSAFVKTPEPYPERDSALKAFREKFDQSTALSDQDQESALEEFKKINEKFPPELATVKDAVDHIEHAVKIAGIDHVGIGTDFDGGGGLKDCFDVSELGNITAELINRKYTDDQIAKIWGGNFIRVFRRSQDA